MRLERSDWSGGGLAFLRHTRDIKPTAFLKTGRGGGGGTQRAVQSGGGGVLTFVDIII